MSEKREVLSPVHEKIRLWNCLTERYAIEPCRAVIPVLTA